MIPISGQNVVLFGGSGFLADALIGRLWRLGAAGIRCVARNEGNLIKTKQHHPYVEIITGDVADPCLVTEAMKERDLVMNLAAFKHVGLAETNTFQCIRSNVVGMMTLLAESFRTRPFLFLFTSTDKAAAPVRGVYGGTKYLGERLMRQAEEINPLTSYRVVRYGNILYSTGSVLCKWKDALHTGQKLIITDPHATRFYWTVEQAVDLILNCLESAGDSTPFVAPMKAIQVGILLEAMIEKYGNGSYPEVETIGLQPGESKHEVLTEGGASSLETEKYTKEEIMNLI